MGAGLGGWTKEAIFEPVASATAGIWRYRGEGWSVVLKLLHHSDIGSPMWLSGDAEDHWYFWQREAIAYESGLLDSLAGPLRAPHCFGVFHRDDGTIAVWLEDLVEMRPAGEWSIERYGLAAEHLGIAQGGCVGMHDHPWLSHDWLRDFVDRRAPLMDELATDAWQHPLLKEAVDPAIGYSIGALWERRSDLLAWVEHAPRTLCHLDLHPKNLFADEAGTVLIDWAFVGIGTVGEDIGNLILDAVWDFHLLPSDVDALAESLIGGYLRGLAVAGHAHDADAVRLAIMAGACVKYLWILPALLGAVRSHQAEINRRPAADTIAAWAPTIPKVVEFGDRAAELAADLHL